MFIGVYYIVVFDIRVIIRYNLYKYTSYRMMII